MNVTTVLVWAGALIGLDHFFCDGHYAATTLLVLSNVYQHWG